MLQYEENLNTYLLCTMCTPDVGQDMAVCALAMYGSII